MNRTENLLLRLPIAYIHVELLILMCNVYKRHEGEVMTTYIGPISCTRG